MLIVTGVLIGFVLVVMVGQTARTMQGTGWVPITPIDVDPPYWLGLWFGVYPTGRRSARSWPPWSSSSAPTSWPARCAYAARAGVPRAPR